MWRCILIVECHHTYRLHLKTMQVDKSTVRIPKNILYILAITLCKDVSNYHINKS